MLITDTILDDFIDADYRFMMYNYNIYNNSNSNTLKGITI